ncbi:MAG: hypothetical protein WAN60_03580 [Candidatus Sulfotelmatobacter sp.]
MLIRHEQFIKERKYLTNVSPATIEWYEQSLRWLPVEEPTSEDLTAVIMAMRDKGLKASADARGFGVGICTK